MQFQPQKQKTRRCLYMTITIEYRKSHEKWHNHGVIGKQTTTTQDAAGARRTCMKQEKYNHAPFPALWSHVPTTQNTSAIRQQQKGGRGKRGEDRKITAKAKPSCGSQRNFCSYANQGRMRCSPEPCAAQTWSGKGRMTGSSALLWAQLLILLCNVKAQLSTA